MHFLTILAFAFVFWQAEQPGRWMLIGTEDVTLILVAVLGQPPALALLATAAARRAKKLLENGTRDAQCAYRFHHRAGVILRALALAGFAATVFLTSWPRWFDFTGSSHAFQIVGDLLTFTPFAVNVLALWLAAYPLEVAVPRGEPAAFSNADSAGSPHWRLRDYLDFHFRHYLLVVACPMTLILFSANVTRGYGPWLSEWTGWIWAPETILGAAAMGVFIVSPAMLRRIWRTKPLEPGAVRARLEATCRRIGMRCRDILEWNSHGIMINAAVMGVFTPVRYVMLSDGLLTAMDPRQVEAVFGHEAGHVKHRHIQHFLVFAFFGWLFVVGVMELCAGLLTGFTILSDGALWIAQGAGALAAVIVWGLGFGWLSRRFEREADVFGAFCVTPPPSECNIPCSLHADSARPGAPSGRGVCASGAALFASALDRVALLNGIPHDERSWRHSSIGNRIRFLARLAGDPVSAQRFERSMRRLKAALLSAAIVGSAFAVYYWWTVPEPAIIRLQARVAGGP